MSGGNPDLILIPCCQSKKGNARISDHKRVADFIGQDMYDLLCEGRRLAFKRDHVCIKETSPLVPALDLYTGHLYRVDRFRESLLKALEGGTHCLILSAGYGLLRPEEPIHWYEAQMQNTRPVWRNRLDKVLSHYLERNRIGTVFVACSKPYFDVLKANARAWARAERTYCYVPQLGRMKTGIALGQAVTELIGREMKPDERWVLLKA